MAGGAVLPRIVAVHISPRHQDELAQELEVLSDDIGVRIDLGYQDMRISIVEEPSRSTVLGPATAG